MHVRCFHSLHWQLSRTHLLVTTLVMTVVHTLMIVILSLYLRGAGQNWAAIGQLLRDALPGLLLFSTMLVLVTGTITAMLFGQLMSRSLRRRLQRLASASQAFAAGNLEQRVDDPQADELGQLAGQLNSMAEQLAETVQTLPRLAVLEDRQRLAYALHDSVTQRLFSLTLLLAAARLEAVPDTALGTMLTELEEALYATLQEARSLIFALHPVDDSVQDLATSLTRLVASAATRQGLQIDLQIHQAPQLPAHATRALLAIVQEALANVLRHSGMRHAQVIMTTDAQQLTLCIRDAGCGFDLLAPRPWTALGLRSMAERARQLHGHCQIESAAGQGTTVQVLLPLPVVAEPPR